MSFDESYLHLINQSWTNPALDRLMAALSSLELWMPVLIGVVLWLLVFGGAKGRAALLAAGLVIAINDGVGTQAGKKLFKRPRPFDSELGTRKVGLESKPLPVFGLFKPVEVSTKDDPLEIKLEGRSFPSGHVVNNFSIAIVLAYFYGPWAWLYAVFAAGVGYSRIYCGAHWPTDVLGSVVTATVMTLAILAMLRFLWVRFGGKWFPRLHAQHPDLFPRLIRT